MKYLLPLLLLATACGPAHVPASLRGEQGDPGIPGESIVGPKGDKGDSGQDAHITTIELCPTIAGDGFHEYLLNIDNNLFGVYASGSRIFLVRLPAGNYVTTDGRSCSFTVNSDGSIT